MILAPSFSEFVVKVASRCNLNCSYCFEYNKADESWKTAPRFMTTDTVRTVAHRIGEHARSHQLDQVRITAHGGEPLLFGSTRLDGFFRAMRQEVPPNVSIRFGLQTNGTLIDESVLEVFYRHRVSVGVSLDGPAEANRHRVDHRGRPSHVETVQGIQALRKYRDGRLFAGLLTVVDVSTDPVEVLEHLASFSPPQIDLLQHFATHDDPPPGSDDPMNPTPFARWMLTAFRYWTETPRLHPIRIRYFEGAISLLLGGSGASDWLGLDPVSYILIATDGGIENLDTLKVVGTAGRVLGLNVECNSFDDALARPEIQMRQGGKDSLCSTCRECSLVDICGGGYFPTRYRAGTGYQNPSVYCNDLKVLLHGIRCFVENGIGREPSSAPVIHAAPRGRLPLTMARV